MNSVLSELDKIKVLDKNDILTIKSYINRKFPENSTSQNAIILSDSINKIIYSSLEGLPNELNLPIKNIIIKNTLGKNKLPITLCDAFEACVTEENIAKNFSKELIAWINLNTKIQFPADILYDYLESKGFTDINLTISQKKDLHPENNVNSDNNIENSIPVEKTSLKSFFSNYLLCLGTLKRIACIVLIAIIIPLYNVSKDSHFNNKLQAKNENCLIESDKNERITTNYPNLHLPKYMRYKEVNMEKLKSFLDSRNSLLAKEPYFSTMFSVAKEFNLNPIVLFSITGQEQNFVPKNNPNAYKIVNNPFNVFHSWKEYNTDINDTAKIASRTVINLSKNRPKDKDPFLWIGRKYAEDKNWGNGVKSIFENLTKYVSPQG